MMEVGQDHMAAEQTKKIARMTLLGTLAGGGIGAIADKGARGQGALAGAGVGAAAGLITGLLLNRPLIVSWDRVQEDKADEMAFKQVLAVNYDVREVPKLYVTIENLARRDTRVGLGFIGDRKRIQNRKEKAADLIANAYKADIEVKLQKGEFIGDSPEHRNLMAELKRDNGIMAYYHDMFEMARNNLKEAVTIRDNDPAAHYFYGKVLEQIGRTPEDNKEAMKAFANAVKFDYRHQNYGANLHYALELMDDNQQQNKQAITTSFDSYVTNYSYWLVENGQMRFFPPNLDPIYEYMRLYGDTGWRPKPPDMKDVPNYSRSFAAYVGEGVPGVPDSGPITGKPASTTPSAAATTTNAIKKAAGSATNPRQAIKNQIPGQ
jgi:predicted Zn-dependent protease